MEKNKIEYPPKIKYPINICFCCKKEKEGAIINNRHVCFSCNHLESENKMEKK